MHNFKCVLMLAHFAFRWLDDAAFLQFFSLFLVAFGADERGDFHFRDHIGAANHDTSESDELFDIRRVHLTDSVDFSEVVGTHLDDGVGLGVVILHFLVGIVLISAAHSNHGVKVALFETLGDNQIENGDDVTWVVF